MVGSLGGEQAGELLADAAQADEGHVTAGEVRGAVEAFADRMERGERAGGGVRRGVAAPAPLRPNDRN